MDFFTRKLTWVADTSYYLGSQFQLPTVRTSTDKAIFELMKKRYFSWDDATDEAKLALLTDVLQESAIFAAEMEAERGPGSQDHFEADKVGDHFVLQACVTYPTISTIRWFADFDHSGRLYNIWRKTELSPPLEGPLPPEL